jgi:predicted Zn-dependent protease
MSWMPPGSKTENIQLRWNCHTAMADALLALGKPQEAVAEYQKAIDVCPTDGWGALYLAKAQERCGRHSEAEATRKNAYVLLCNMKYQESEVRRMIEDYSK